MSYLQQHQNDPASILAHLQLGLSVDETAALSLLSSITNPIPNSATIPTTAPDVPPSALSSNLRLAPDLIAAPIHSMLSQLFPQTSSLDAQTFPLNTQGHPGFSGSSSPVSNVDANIFQQLMQVQQVKGMQQLVVNMLAQYQQTQVAVQTQTILSLLIPMVNIQQPENQIPVDGKQAQKESSGSKKDPKEKYKKPGNKQYKTEMCKTFEETGQCRYGKKCQFAHGCEDLRNSPKHPKFKTVPCETIVNGGCCPYGRRCRFIHPSDDQVEPGMFSCKVIAQERRLPVFEELAPSQSAASSCDDSEQA